MTSTKVKKKTQTNKQTNKPYIGCHPDKLSSFKHEHAFDSPRSLCRANDENGGITSPPHKIQNSVTRYKTPESTKT